MPVLEKEQITPASPEQLSPHTQETFSDAEELVLDIQDSPAFAEILEQYNIPFDDTTSEYWEAVRFVTEKSIKLGEYADNTPLLQAMRIVAATPDAAYKQYFLDNAEAYQLDYETRQSYVRDVSMFNDRTRDYLADNLDTPFDQFSLLLTESASKGIDQQLIQPVAFGMKARLKGIRAELGLEQKAAAAGISVQRGTTEQDLKGIDYIIDGVPFDIKSSLHDVVANRGANIDKPYFIKGGKVTLFPYDYAQDYEAGSFRIKEDVIQERARQLALDIGAIKKKLA